MRNSAPSSPTLTRPSPPDPAPRFGTPRDPSRPTTGGRVAAAAAALGRPLHPHQRWIVDVAGEVEPATGLPAYPDVVVVMPRRGGKTITVLAALLERMRRRPTVRAFYTAQGAEEAGKVLRDEWHPLVHSSPLRRVVRFRFARGDAGMYVQVGPMPLSRVEIFTPNANALHGRDSDLTVVDEAWSFTAERGADIDAGIRPARWARPDSQIWWVTAGGTPDSGYLHKLMDRGRAGEPGLAYFEWSADRDAPGYDPYDPALWLATHPGIGRTCSLENIEADARAMSRPQFERALLCVWDRGVGTSLLAGWDDRVSPAAAPAGPLTVAFDIHPDRTSAAIAVAGGGAVELVDHREGTGWVAGRLAQLVDNHDPGLIVRDAGGPAGATRLELEGAAIHDVTGAELAEACAWLVDAIRDGGVDIRPHPALAVAFAGARTRNLGDGKHVWVRRSPDVDLTPLYALTLAGWGSDTAPVGQIF
jgi:hypothetical protein